jgi:hypothetical protein
MSIEEDFKELTRKWLEETMFSSNTLDTILNVHYQQIISIGRGDPEILRLILEDLKITGNHWFYALYILTQGADPAVDCPPGDMRAVQQAWLAWGREKKIIN